MSEERWTWFQKWTVTWLASGATALWVIAFTLLAIARAIR